MKITATILGHQPLTLEVLPNDTVASVKKKIEVATRIPVAQQSLKFREGELSDTYKIADYNIRKGHTITVELAVPATDGITVIIKLGTSEASLSVKPTDTIEAFKEKIKAMTGIPIDQLSLSATSGELDADDYSLEDYGIENGAVITTSTTAEHNASFPPVYRSSPQMEVPRATGGEERIILVMGATGTGKSTFINTLLGEERAVVGHKFESQTDGFQAISFHHKGENFTLVDTIGLGDTNKSTLDVLNDTVAYVSRAYQEGRKVSGIFYLQRIDVRMQQSERLNLRLFKKLIGDDSMRNVILLTTQWSRLGPQENGPDREEELKQKFWKDLVANKAKVERLPQENDRTFALSLLESMLDIRPTVLDIQSQVVDEKMGLADTSLGKAILEMADEQAATTRQSIDGLHTELQTATGGDRKAILAELEEAKEKLANVEASQRAVKDATSRKLLERGTVGRLFWAAKAGWKIGGSFGLGGIACAITGLGVGACGEVLTQAGRGIASLTGTREVFDKKLAERWEASEEFASGRGQRKDGSSTLLPTRIIGGVAGATGGMAKAVGGFAKDVFAPSPLS